MIKYILLFFLFILNINASIIHFEEKKYIEVLDNTIVKEGFLEFQKEQISLKYTNSDKILIYENNNLLIKNGEDIQNIDLEKQLILKMIFLLIEAIHKDNFEVLKEYFIIDKKDKITMLKPNESLKNYIKNVEFKKNKKLDFITIKMSNGNITTIKQIND